MHSHSTTPLPDALSHTHINVLPILEVPTANPTFPGENDTDPFLTTVSIDDETRLLARDDVPRPLFLLYLLVSWLHTHFHLPFLACNVVLVVVLNILRYAGTSFSDLHPRPYVTLTTVSARLGVEPVFQVLPVCPTCFEPHPFSTSKSAICDHCSEPLFRVTRRLDRRQRGARDEITTPFLQFPTKSIEGQLRDILAVPGMEDTLEAWRSIPRSAGVYQDNFDGEICRTLPGPDELPFFQNPIPGGSDELRIGVTLGVDW